MPEITRRRQGEMTQALFRILAEAPNGIPAREAVDRVEEVLRPRRLSKTASIQTGRACDAFPKSFASRLSVR